MYTFYATGLLFFTWPMIALTLLLDYVWIALCFGLSLRIAGAKDWWSAFKSRFFAVFVASFGCDALLAALLLATLALAQADPRLDVWLEHPFVGLGGSLTALGCMAAVGLCGLLKGWLYRNVVLKKVQCLEKREIRAVSVLLAVMTAPWTFLLPTVTAGTWMGEMMVAVGGIAGNASPESLAGLMTPIP